MTKAAAHFGKRLDHFMSAPDTVQYVEALKANSPNSGDYLELTRGRYGGSFAHPKLAVFFARWLDVRFAVWCDAVIRLHHRRTYRHPATEPAEQSAGFLLCGPYFVLCL